MLTKPPSSGGLSSSRGHRITRRGLRDEGLQANREESAGPNSPRMRIRTRRLLSLSHHVTSSPRSRPGILLKLHKVCSEVTNLAHGVPVTMKLKQEATESVQLGNSCRVLVNPRRKKTWRQTQNKSCDAYTFATIFKNTKDVIKLFPDVSSHQRRYHCSVSLWSWPVEGAITPPVPAWLTIRL